MSTKAQVEEVSLDDDNWSWDRLKNAVKEKVKELKAKYQTPLQPPSQEQAKKETPVQPLPQDLVAQPTPAPAPQQEVVASKKNTAAALIEVKKLGVVVAKPAVPFETKNLKLSAQAKIPVFDLSVIGLFVFALFCLSSDPIFQALGLKEVGHTAVLLGAIGVVIVVLIGLLKPYFVKTV
jgi:hypothetical protein